MEYKKSFFDNLFNIKDLKALFCGHNIMFDKKYDINSYLKINKNNIEDYIKLGNRYNIDTGCYLRLGEEYMNNDMLPDFTIYHLNTMKCIYSIGS